MLKYSSKANLCLIDVSDVTIMLVCYFFSTFIVSLLHRFFYELYKCLNLIELSHLKADLNTLRKFLTNFNKKQR